MLKRLDLGVIPGLIAGLVMAGTAYLSRLLGLLPFNPLVVSADILLPKAAAVTSTGLVVGFVVHVALSMIFGAIFAYFVYPEAGLVMGLAYGIVLEVLNGAILGPWLGVVPPIMTLSGTAILASLANRLVYGAFLGYLVGMLAARRVETQ